MTPPPDPDSWSELLRRARADRPPEIDFSALLRAARTEAARAPAAPAASLFEEFALLFATPRALCAAGAVAALVLWLGYSDWQQLDLWADVALGTLGVAS